MKSRKTDFASTVQGRCTSAPLLRGMALGIVIALCLGAATDKWKPWTLEGKPEYVVKRTAERPDLHGKWDSPPVLWTDIRAVWQQANELQVSHFLSPASQKQAADVFRPETRARVLYDAAGLYVFFQVKDKYIRSVATEYRGKVWEDACAEFFVQPKPDRGYFNFEINCGGTMLLSYHENPDWKGEVKGKDGGVPWELARTVQIYHSMPEKVDPEIAEEKVWQLEYHIPFAVLEEYVGPLGDVAGQMWRANFYKCAETNSHPHWASWSPLLEGFDFHSPRFFGVLHFAAAT
jgi:hypothetical protein